MTDRTILILGHPYDPGTRSVRAELRPGPARPVLVLTPELAAATTWAHRVGTDGQARTALRLPGGRRLTDQDIGCVLNRWDHLPAARLTGASERDREYGALEWQALMASWLAGLAERVVNRPNALAMDAGPRSPRGWLALAVAAGLPVARSVLATTARLVPAGIGGPARPLGPFAPAGASSTGRTPVTFGWAADPTNPDYDDPLSPAGAVEVLVVGGRSLGAPTAGIGDACVDVANRAGCSIVAFRFGGGPGEDAVLQRVCTRPTLVGAGHASAVADLCREIAQWGDPR